MSEENLNQNLNPEESFDPELSAAVDEAIDETAVISAQLKELTSAREIRLVITVDTSLIGGFLIKTESKIIDFTIKNQLQQLAKHLDTVLDI